MKYLLTIAIVICSFMLQAQSTEKQPLPDSTKKLLMVEAACGQCQFKMTGKGDCDLAIRTEGKAYFVDGTKIDDHGDAHGVEGLCNAIRKAEVQGEVVKDRFQSTYFRLLPVVATVPKSD